MNKQFYAFLTDFYNKQSKVRVAVSTGKTQIIYLFQFLQLINSPRMKTRACHCVMETN